MDAQRGIARRMVVGLPADGIHQAWEKDFSAYAPAGVIIFRRDFEDLDALRRLTARLRALVQPRRLFIAVDEEGGTVSQLAGHLVIPPNALLLGRGAEPGDIEWVSRITGERLRALGIDWVLAPVADVHSEPRNPVIGPRSFGETAAEVLRRVAEAVRGYQAAGIACCLKHFPGHGDTQLDSHLELPTNDAGSDVLENRELLPFRKNRGADSVMSAHVVYPAFDKRPATFSRLIMSGVLRDGFGFEGVCVTDALEMKGASEGRALAQAGQQALEAGCDLLLWADHQPELRRARLELARALVDGAMGRAMFDVARPRLERFDRTRPPPTPEELARPLDSLTPEDWEPRLEQIVERGLIERGARPAEVAAGPWNLDGADATIRKELARREVPIGGDKPAMHIVSIASRTPLDQDQIDMLRQQCVASPTVVIGLQNDAFLDALPEATLRISAADATPLTQSVVAKRLAAVYRQASESRA